MSGIGIAKTMFLLLSLAATAGCSAELLTPAVPGGAAASETSPELEAMARDVFDRINQRRQSIGLPPHRWDSTLGYIAAEHSSAMASGSRPFGHDGFDSRIAAARSTMSVSRGSENVARNTYPASQTVGAAVSGWIDSPGHRQNLEGNYTVTGVGVARAADGEYFLTQIFIAN